MLKMQSIDEMYETFKQVGKVTGKEKEANALVKETKIILKKVNSVPKDANLGFYGSIFRT